MKTKAELRKFYERQRQSITPAEQKTRSRIVAMRLLELPWEKFETAHIYSSNPDWNEVDTEPLIQSLHERFPSINIVSPPARKNAPLPDGRFDVVVVPVLAFDKDNYRLGWGGGWYDRFLADQPKALKIGLAWADSELERLPREPHDIRLDKIFTEQSIMANHADE